jgi:hypothetical protein
VKQTVSSYLKTKDRHGVSTKSKRKPTTHVTHLMPPLKGLSRFSELNESDPRYASSLTNWIVETDRITVRPGYIKFGEIPTHTPISSLVPYQSDSQRFIAAADRKFYDTSGTVISSGWNNDYWAWTMFSNLGAIDYTVMVNGSDGVVSWDGLNNPDGAPVTVTDITKTNPARVVVAAADIGKFTNGMNVYISGAAGDFKVCNGNQVITSVGSPANSFTLPGINLSAATTTFTGPVQAIPRGSFVRENVTAPPGEVWINPLRLDKVYAHMNRLFFADSDNMAVYYLPVQQKSGELKVLPLNAIFRRGGHVQALHSWSVDGGAGMDDGLVVFTSNGECAIYQGVDPATDWSLVGVFRFDSPMSKTSVINFGGDLYVMISSGFVPLTTLIRAETENLGKEDLNVMNEFEQIALGHRDDYGWGVILNSHSNHAICNMPTGNGQYQQMVRMMPDKVWTKWTGVPARCWLWFDNKAFFGSEDGKIYRAGPEYLTDDGNSIKADVRFAWSSYRTPAKKNFTMVKLYVITDGQPQPYIDMEVDYNELRNPINQPEISTGPGGGAAWNTATWDVDYWAAMSLPKPNWQGITGLGRVGAPHVHVEITGCVFSITGLDVLFESGGWL